MSDSPAPINLVSESGIAAQHPPLDASTPLVAPTTAAEFNRLKIMVAPIGCWRVDDLCFDFDSSFPGPRIRAGMQHLAQLLAVHAPPSQAARKQPAETTGCPLSVFAHADPVGSDDYNKQLSGRRATAIYGLLTHDAELWDSLYAHPLGNDTWGKPALQSMLDMLAPASGADTGSPAPDAAQVEHDAAQRKSLYLRYMQALWAPNLKLQKTDFLGGGEDADGRADYQGCGEFNPMLLTSQQEESAFQQDQDKTERNAANAPNRRVMVLIFRKGSRVDPGLWPCPRVKEGVAACRKRFWSDGEKRRGTRLPDQQREYSQTKDTFACRFYDRLTDKSPCERIVKLVALRIKLIDDHDQPYAGLKYRLEVSGGEFDGVVKSQFEGTTNEGGVVENRIPATATTGKLTLLHVPDDGKGDPAELWTLDLQIVADLGGSDSVAGAQARLNNLGFYAGTGDTVQPDHSTERALQRFKVLYRVNGDDHKLDFGPHLTTQTSDHLRHIYGS